MAFDFIFNPIFFPVLKLHPFFAIGIIALVLSIIMTVAYKYLTNQVLMKSLKDEIKELQTEMKSLKDNPKQMLEVQKRAMETNMKYFMQSLKPTLVTFIPLIIIFAWLNAHMVYYPLVQDTEFSVHLTFEESGAGVEYLTSENTSLQLLNAMNQTVFDKTAKFVFKAKEPGDYNATFQFRDSKYVQQLHIVSDINDRTYDQPIQKVNKDGLLEIVTSNDEVKPLQNLFLLGWIPWVKNFGWLGTYILLSIVFSLVLRKVMKVY